MTAEVINEAIKQWESTTQCAIRAYQKGHLHNAIEHHRAALLIAKNNLDTTLPEAPGKAIASIMVSHFNLSEVYTDLSDYVTAQWWLKKANKTLLRISETPHTNGEQTTAIYRASRQLNLEWTKFLKNHKHTMDDLGLHAPARIEQQIIGNLSISRH